MKFLFFSGGAHLVWDPSGPRAAGGAEMQAALMARELVARGHETVLLGTDTGQPDGAVWEGIRVRHGGRYGTGGVADTLAAWPVIHRVLREEKPDFVVVYGWTSLLYALAIWRRIVPFRLVFVCALDAEIDGEFRRRHPLRGYFFQRGMRAADARLSITGDQAAHFRRQGMPCEVTRLLLRAPAHVPAADKPVDLLWVARCENVKRPELFLRLVASMPGTRARMICSLHDRGLFAKTEADAARIPNLEFLPGVPYREIQSHFDQSKIFVNTSSHEGVPNTFIHAGQGRTAIASLEIDPDRMFDEFAAGVQAGGDYGSLAAGIGALLSDRTRLDRAACEAARYVTEWHNNQTNVDAFLRGVQAA